ncbi:conserved exported hypothetical protein [Candidatus Propionivibrio aalborgensis]|uniref:Uncharacterized protein n=1 Tax=Candidatus Propionivibrio aalborgensis TaxID=1860101 RepID=A0A1A8XFN7_9RHOO|nr:hypothetical protein [Candidatus Propionivibrio aalborgensis]SBT03994.1 conserved exported hypothetical protein [Candidatus Propionivibrio aalborgensis]
MHKAYGLGSVLLVLLSMGASAAEVALVTAASGNVKLQEGKAAASELKPFIKVREGDRLLMEGASRLQVVYFEGGRQETWSGRGALEVGNVSSKAIKGTMQPEIKTLPAILVKQLAKTPAQDGNVKTGMIRMRSMPPYDRLETVEKNYDEMRKQAVAGDLNPELYLLASYFELREFDKLEALLRQLNEKASETQELAALNMLYARAIRDAKSTAKQ